MKTSDSYSVMQEVRFRPTVKASIDFLENEGDLLELAKLAKAWSVRPSALVEATGVEAYQIDLACSIEYSHWLEQVRRIQNSE